MPRRRDIRVSRRRLRTCISTSLLTATSEQPLAVSPCERLKPSVGLAHESTLAVTPPRCLSSSGHRGTQVLPKSSRTLWTDLIRPIRRSGTMWCNRHPSPLPFGRHKHRQVLAVMWRRPLSSCRYWRSGGGLLMSRPFTAAFAQAACAPPWRHLTRHAEASDQARKR